MIQVSFKKEYRYFFDYFEIYFKSKYIFKS